MTSGTVGVRASRCCPSASTCSLSFQRVFDCEIGYDGRSLSHSSSLLGLGWSSHCVALQRMTAPPFTTLLRGVYQIIQTNAQGRDSRLFVQTCMFRSALPGWGTPKTRSRFGIRGAAQILWEFDRAIPLALRKFCEKLIGMAAQILRDFDRAIPFARAAVTAPTDL
jgi:hypothetical protein